MYYMMGYIGAAYDYVTLGADEISTLTSNYGLEATEENARMVAKALVAAATKGYTPSVEYTAKSEQYSGQTLGLDIAVDLRSTPVYVITLNGASWVKVNGVELTARSGEFVYEIQNLHSFDGRFTIETDLGTATFSYANYVKAAEGTEVADITVALYQYILSARAYVRSINP